MTTPKTEPAEKPPVFDDVLRRMLAAPPAPKEKPKPAAKPAQQKPAT